MKTAVLATVLAFAAVARADVLSGWTFENATIGGPGTDFGPIAADAVGQVFSGEARGHHALPPTAWSFPAGNGSPKSFSSNNWSAGDYYQFRTSSIGYQNITISWHQTRSSTGPEAFELMWSLDGLLWNPIPPTYPVTPVTWTSTPPPQPPFFGPLPAPPVLDNQPFIYFRLVSQVTPAPGGTNRVDNIVISGTIIPILTGACCVGWNCTIQTPAACASMLGRYLGDGTTCALNPCEITDVVKCEPQPPNHPTTYWYDVTPGGGFGRCDFHVQVFDSNAANYTNIVMPPTWQFAIHQVGTQWWASWWDADCSNAIFGLFRFQFDHPNASQWGHWRTTISATNDPTNEVIDQSENHATLADGYGYRVHVPTANLPTGACCVGWNCTIQERIHCVNDLHGRYLGDGTTCDLIVADADPNLPIPDGIVTGVSNTLDFPLSTPIIGARIDLIIAHANLADLRVSVTHGPTSIMLWDGRCPGRQDMNVVFSDAGTGLVCGTPTLGTITPSSAGGTALAAFNGQDSLGPWTIVVSDIVTGNAGTLLHWSVHVPGNPCAVKDRVVCEPQPPNHPNTYWYDVTPGGGFGRCDFHVEVFDPNPAHYTNVIMPPTWQFAVHQVGAQWWASWWDPDCDNAIFGPNPTRFQFTNTYPSTWGQWRTTISANNDPYDVETIDESGHHASEPDGSGYRVHVPIFTEAWYWKDCNGATDAGYLPDFDQRQDFNGDGAVDPGYCGPTAVANSLWWFNCKYPAAGIVPANWGPTELIQDLAQRMATNGQTSSPNGHAAPFSGTYYDDMQSGIDAYLTARGVNTLLYEHTEVRPSFEYIAGEVQRSQDVTLLVGFWHIEAVNFQNGVWTIFWKRVGGHYVTVAGVDPLNKRVALSDPDGDFAEHGYTGVVRPPGTDHNHDGDNNPATTIGFRNANYAHAVHNNDTRASHDYYALLPSISPGGNLALVLDGNPLTYGQEMQAYHPAENGGEMVWPIPNEVTQGDMRLLWPYDPDNFAPPVVCQYYSEVEAAIVVSPFEDCGPQDDGLACKPVQCPIPTQQCLPKRIRHHIPTLVFPIGGTDLLTPTSGHMEIMDPLGNVFTFVIREDPPNATTVIRGNPVPVGGHREIEMEMVQLDLVADGGGGGGGMVAYVRESPTLPSHGRVVGAMSTTTDYPADSFFDIFVEIDIPNIGALGLRNESPIPLAAPGITAVPPLGASFNTPVVWDGVELYTPTGQGTGFRIVGVTHILPPPPPTWEVIECECMDPNHCHISLPDGSTCIGTCPVGYDCVRLGMTSPDGTYEDLWCECLPAPLGVCCQPNSGCAVTTAGNCPAPGVWHPEWSTCTPNPCPCILMGDLDGNGYRNGRDVQGFVTCVFGGGSYCPCGDFTHDGLVNANDLSGFLSELLMGP